MFFQLFHLTRDLALKDVQNAKTYTTGTCFADDGVAMRFRLYDGAAYVLPPKSVRNGKPKGTWLSRRGLLLMATEDVKSGIRRHE